MVGALGKVKTNVDSGVFQAVQEAAITGLEGGDGDKLAEYCAIYKERRDLLVGAIPRAGPRMRESARDLLRLGQSSTGYTSVSFTERVLKEAGVAITPGSGFGKGGEGYVRFSLDERTVGRGGGPNKSATVVTARMPNRAFIGIGSNLGDRAANYREAIQRIASIPDTRVVRQSSIYETEPMGDLKGAFLNGVIEVETELPAEVLMRRMLAIERIMGRKRVKGRKQTRGKYRPRIIDLDLLFFNKETIDTRVLKVPHPRLHERRFVLAPMSELAPALIHPKLNASISEMLAGLKSPFRVTLARADLLRPQPPPKREASSR